MLFSEYTKFREMWATYYYYFAFRRCSSFIRFVWEKINLMLKPFKWLYSFGTLYFTRNRLQWSCLPHFSTASLNWVLKTCSFTQSIKLLELDVYYFVFLRKKLMWQFSSEILFHYSEIVFMWVSITFPVPLLALVPLSFLLPCANLKWWFGKWGSFFMEASAQNFWKGKVFYKVVFEQDLFTSITPLPQKLY